MWYAVRCSYSYWLLLVCFIRTIEGHCLLHWLSYMHLLRGLLDTPQLHSIVSWKEQTGYLLVNFFPLLFGAVFIMLRLFSELSGFVLAILL